MKNMLNWFEVPVKDFERAKKFYETIFEIEMPQNQMGDYLMGFFPAFEGKVSGAIVQGMGYEPSMTGHQVYLNGNPDLQNVLDRVTAAGGEVMVPKTQITPEIGWFAFIKDSEGNKVALHSQN
jgi:predicted enzyme related to lactoylglutathione lyase